ncbi:MAG: sigma-70 family RNA polymerase sigma factor, partial [Hyphomicrobiales bacterium]
VDEGDTPDVIYEQQEELDHRRALLKEAIDVLDERETRIFQARRIEEPSLTLEQLSEEFGVSRERIRQIEVRAFEKVQRAVKRLSRESLQSNIEAIEAPNH